MSEKKIKFVYYERVFCVVVWRRKWKTFYGVNAFRKTKMKTDENVEIYVHLPGGNVIL